MHFVNIEVEQRRSRVFHRSEALIEFPGGVDALDQVFGNRLPCLRMPRKAPEAFRLQEPVFKKLRGKLDEIAVDARAGEAAVGHIGKKTMQRMAKLMEQRASIVQAEERRRPAPSLREVHDVDDDGKDFSIQAGLFLETAHPGAAAL